MARLALVAALAVFCVCGAEKQADKQDAKIRELTAELEAVKKQIGECDTKLVEKSESSYVTVEDIVGATGAVTESLGLSSLDVSSVVKPMVEAVNLGISKVDLNVSQVTEVVSSSYDAAYKKVSAAASVLQEHHDQYVLPHAGEYYGAAKPHMDKIQTAVYDTVNAQLPHLKEGISAAHVGFREKMKDLFEQLTLKASAALSGAPSGILEKLYEKQEVVIMGWSKTFTHGYLDIMLFFVQSIVNIYVLALFICKLWSYVIRFAIYLGFKTLFGSVKLGYGFTKTSSTIAFKLVFYLLSMTFCFFMLAVMCALSLSLVHGIHTGAKSGMDPKLRLAIGMGVGALLFLPFYCCCCCRKRKTESSKKSTSEKAASNGKSATSGKAPSQPQPAKKESAAKATSKTSKASKK